MPKFFSLVARPSPSNAIDSLSYGSLSHAWEVGNRHLGDAPKKVRAVHGAFSPNVFYLSKRQKATRGRKRAHLEFQNYEAGFQRCINTRGVL